MRQPAEYMNRNSGLPTFGVIAIWTLYIVISTMHLCPLYKLQTFQDILMKLLKNEKH